MILTLVLVFQISNDSSASDEPTSCSQAPKALADNDSWPLKTNQIIVKAVFGRVL